MGDDQQHRDHHHHATMSYKLIARFRRRRVSKHAECEPSEPVDWVALRGVVARIANGEPGVHVPANVARDLGARLLSCCVSALSDPQLAQKYRQRHPDFFRRLDQEGPTPRLAVEAVGLLPMVDPHWARRRVARGRGLILVRRRRSPVRTRGTSRARGAGRPRGRRVASASSQRSRGDPDLSDDDPPSKAGHEYQHPDLRLGHHRFEAVVI